MTVGKSKDHLDPQTTLPLDSRSSAGYTSPTHLRYQTVGDGLLITTSAISCPRVFEASLFLESRHIASLHRFSGRLREVDQDHRQGSLDSFPSSEILPQRFSVLSRWVGQRALDVLSGSSLTSPLTDAWRDMSLSERAPCSRSRSCLWSDLRSFGPTAISPY